MSVTLASPGCRPPRDLVGLGHPVRGDLATAQGLVGTDHAWGGAEKVHGHLREIRGAGYRGGTAADAVEHNITQT